jgi:hypothetical protein
VRRHGGSVMIRPGPVAVGVTLGVHLVTLMDWTTQSHAAVASYMPAASRLRDDLVLFLQVTAGGSSSQCAVVNRATARECPTA